jgi:hypothetical protein
MIPFVLTNHNSYLLYLWGLLAAGTKATVGNGLENGMGMTEGTEYMK